MTSSKKTRPVRGLSRTWIGRTRPQYRGLVPLTGTTAHKVLDCDLGFSGSVMGQRDGFEGVPGKERLPRAQHARLRGQRPLKPVSAAALGCRTSDRLGG
jgi:hypothetical protein